MKKHFFAYRVQSKKKNKQPCEISLEERKNTEDNQLYEEILKQMSSHHNQYINKLITRQEKKDSVEKQNHFTHERKKSYTSLLLDNVLERKSSRQKCHKLKKNHINIQGSLSAKFIKTNIYSPTNQVTENLKPSFSSPKKISEPSQSLFLESLDQYIHTMSSDNKSNENQVSKRRTQKERKTISKSKQISMTNMELIKKLQIYEKKINDLKLNNHILKVEETKQRKKNRELKSQMEEMLIHITYVQKKLEKEKQEKREIQDFFTQFQMKFSKFHPVKKKDLTISRHRRKPANFLFEEGTTQQEISDFQYIYRNKPWNSGQKTNKLKKMMNDNKPTHHNLYTSPWSHLYDSEESQASYD